MQDLLRPDDSDAFRGALRVVRRHTGAPLAFGGQLRADEAASGVGDVRLTEFDGLRTQGLRGLVLQPGAGLGGQVIASRQPSGVLDYAHDESITHDYDAPVLAEGIRSIAAAPVTVAGRIRGILYAGGRGSFALGGRATDALVGVARQLGGELAVRDEVDRRLALVAADTENRRGGLGGEVLEEIRDLQGELRRIAQGLDDAGVRERLRVASDRLADLGRVRPAPGTTPALTPRELDVLGEVALGCSNAEAAQRLSVSAETVKAYLRSAMTKLEAHNRTEAVVAARRAGLLA